MLIVIGASAGGVAALKQLVADLPADLAAPVAVVLHIGVHPSQIVDILQQRAQLRVAWGTDGAELRPGEIVVAPPDHHLLVEGDVLRVLKGPRENLARPAIDPLFRSAAESAGPAAIGVLLTGRLNDGTAGLFEIKRRGGIAVVQDPSTAEQPSMPRSAIEHVEVDHVVALEEIGGLLATLARAAPTATIEESSTMHASTRGIHQPTAFVCPDCGGAMARIHDASNMLQYVCHTGHRVTGEILAEHQLRDVERHIETTIRLLNEAAGLAVDFQTVAQAEGNPAGVESWRRAEARLLELQARVLELGEELPSAGEVEMR